jgi:hypothetical protein
MTSDKWAKGGTTILEPAVQAQLRRIIEDESALVVEHRFYRGSRAPHRFVCDDFEELVEYVRASSSPGDAFLFWRFEDCCTDSNVAIGGKVPDSEGRTPVGGAY